MSNLQNIYFPHIINGPHNPLFFKNASIVEAAIKKMKLEPVILPQVKGKPELDKDLTFEPPWWKYGGMKVAHLHFADRVYMLNSDQWKDFSRTLLAAFRTQLDRAGSVSFENALNISNELENIM